MGIVGAGAALAVSIAGVGWFNRWMDQRKAPVDPLEVKGRAASKALLKLHQERKLRKWMDPVAQELLEAGAYHFGRLRTALEGPAWSARDLPTHWETVRAQARAAGESAMWELVLLCNTCVGKPQVERKDGLKSVIEDFVDLDIADALQGLKEIASGDWARYAHTSPAARQIFEPGRQIAERLRDLADEIEARAPELGGSAGEALPRGSVGSIDAVLGELRAVRQAEEELRQEQQHLRG